MTPTKPIVLAALVVGFFVAIGTFQAKSSPSYLQMTIVNGNGIYGLTGDGQKTDGGNSIYTDHDLPNGDQCVTATLNNGYIVVQQNYVLSTHPKQGWCNAQSGVTPRSWNIVIDDTVVCKTVFGISASAPCTFKLNDMTSTDYEGVVPGGIFTSSSSQITMVFTLDDRTTGYGVRTDGTAMVTGVGNTRTVTYNSTAQLYLRGEPTGTGSFNFPFQLIFKEL
jgi:hypothetical protein